MRSEIAPTLGFGLLHRSTSSIPGVVSQKEREHLSPLPLGEDLGEGGDVGWAEYSNAQQTLTAQFKTQFEESDKLETAINKNLAGLGYEL